MRLDLAAVMIIGTIVILLSGNDWKKITITVISEIIIGAGLVFLF